jgi:hypothetical protein
MFIKNDNIKILRFIIPKQTEKINDLKNDIGKLKENLSSIVNKDELKESIINNIN